MRAERDFAVNEQGWSRIGFATTRSETGGDELGTTGVPLKICLFGAVQVWVHDKLLVLSEKQGFLLGLLALAPGTTLSYETLQDQLWPDSGARDPTANVRAARKDLRRALGDQAYRLKSPSRSKLHLNLERAEVDFIAFNAALKLGDPVSLADAEALYQGPLMRECGDNAIISERERCEKNYLDALDKLAAIAQGEGDLPSAERYLRRAIETDPTNESWSQRLMRVLADQGRQVEALEHSTWLRDWLAKEHEVEPAPETTALEQQIQTERRQQARAQSEQEAAYRGEALDPLILHWGKGSLPGYLTELVGREREVASIVAELSRQGTRRLVVLTGIGGIGKTRLAVEAAKEYARQFPIGVRFVDLGDIKGEENGRVVREVAEALGLRETSEQPLIELLVGYLKSRAALLILDTCETVIEHCADLAKTLLSACGSLRILATSRKSLPLVGVPDLPVPRLSLPDLPTTPMTDIEVGALPSQSAAVRLFLDRARAAKPEFELTARTAPWVMRICRRLEGIPFALELAAAWLRALSIQQIDEQLARPFEFLTGGDPTAPARQRTLLATMNWSYELLSPQEQTLLRRLSIFIGGFDLDALERVAAAGDTVEQALQWLRGLVESSLVQQEERDGRHRYQMLDTIREFAREQLTKCGETAALEQRQAFYYLARAEEAAPQMWSAEAEQTRLYLDAELGNLRTALGWLREQGDFGAGLKLCGALAGYWQICGYWVEGYTWTTEFLRMSETAALPVVDTLDGLERDGEGGAAPTHTNEVNAGELAGLRETAIRTAGMLAQMQGDGDTAGSWYEQGLPIARRLGRDAAIAVYLNNLGVLSTKRGDWAQADRYLEESLRLYGALGDRKGMAKVWNNQGNIAYERSEYELARALYEKSLAVRRELGVPNLIAAGLNALGKIALRLRDYQAAQSYFSESLDKAQVAGDKQGIGQLLANLGTVALEVGDLAEARSRYETALPIYRECNARASIAECLCNIALVRYFEGDYGGARAYVEEGLTLANEQNNKSQIASCLSILADISLMEGNPDVAERLQRESLKIRKSLEERWEISFCLTGLAGVAWTRKQHSRAAQLFGAASALRKQCEGGLPSVWQQEHDQRVGDAREKLGDGAFQAAWAAGEAMSLEEMVELGLGTNSDIVPDGHVP